MTSTYSVHYGSTIISYEISFAARKTLTIEVS